MNKYMVRSVNSSYQCFKELVKNFDDKATFRFLFGVDAQQFVAYVETTLEARHLYNLKSIVVVYEILDIKLFEESNEG